MSKSFKVKSLSEGAVAIVSNDGKEQIQFTENESKDFSEAELAAFSDQISIFANINLLSVVEAKAKKTQTLVPTEPPADDKSNDKTEDESNDKGAPSKAELNADQINQLKADLAKLGEEYKAKKTTAERKEAIKVESVNIKKKLRSLK